MTREQRRAAYAGDITYCSNKELAFDYLRDRTALGDRASALHLRASTAVRGQRGASGAGLRAARAELRASSTRPTASSSTRRARR